MSNALQRSNVQGIRLVSLSALVTFLFACAPASDTLTDQTGDVESNQISSEYIAPGEVEAPEATWDGYIRSAFFVPMSDGTKIAVDVLLPKTFVGEGDPIDSFPVVFEYTPYQRSFLLPQTGKVFVPREREFFLNHGYAYVSADMRGTGASFGYKSVSLEKNTAIRDGGELVNWIADQTWSDGNVGMRGGSFEGLSQLWTASEKPEALKAIIPTVNSFQRFGLRPGGIFSGSFLEIWDDLDSTSSVNRIPTGNEGGFALPPAPPVVDEDGDGELFDEFPIDKNGNGYFADDYVWPIDPNAPPEYADGEERPNAYYFNAVMEHVLHPDGAPGNQDASYVVKTQSFMDFSEARGGQTASAATNSYGLLPDVADSGVAIYNIGGWFDGFPRATFLTYATLAETNPSRVSMFPIYHQGISANAAEVLGVPAELVGATRYTELMFQEQLRWFDRWLKNIDNGIDREPPVNIFVFNGEGWRGEQEWPLAREQRTSFFVSSEQTLQVEQTGQVGQDQYLAEMSHSSGWFPMIDNQALVFKEQNSDVGSIEYGPRFLPTNRQQMMGIPETAPFRTEATDQILAYTSSPLSEDIEVTGHPLIKVWVSSSEDYGDLHFYLEDVAPDGTSLLVSEQPHRVGFSKLVDDDEIIVNNETMDLKPDLPWHGFRKRDYTDAVFADGAIIEVTTDFNPVSWVFREGHRIRFSIAAADWPTYELHPKLAPQNDPTAPDTITPVITLHYGGDMPSQVVLPIIPAKIE